jgi:hypothetical protein
MDTAKLHDLIDKLPAALQKQVYDFASSLLAAQERRGSGHRRVAGLHEGVARVSEDFDDPLPDAFWLGEE